MDKVNWKRRCAVFIICVMAIAWVAMQIKDRAGSFLVVDETPANADVILVFSGDKGSRTEKAVELYKAHYSDKIILSGGPVYNNITMAGLMFDHAVASGVRPEDIILEESADSTFQNAAYCRDIMEAKGYQSAIVVSSEYHMRRVRLSCEKAFVNSNIHLIYCAADEPFFDPSKWWANNKSLMSVITEYIKIMGYMAGHES